MTINIIKDYTDILVDGILFESIVISRNIPWSRDTMYTFQRDMYMI